MLVLAGHKSAVLPRCAEGLQTCQGVSLGGQAQWEVQRVHQHGTDRLAVVKPDKEVIGVTLREDNR